MRPIFRSLSLVSLVLAIAAVFGLLLADGVNQLQYTPLHQQTGALAFVLIGSSLIWEQLSSRGSKEKLKQTLLGLAFILWGGEQFISSGPIVTILDSVVVLIFVCDLSLVILSRLKQKE
jgi:hypothetical protein